MPNIYLYMDKVKNILDTMHENGMYDGKIPFKVFNVLSTCARTHTACIISLRTKDNAWTFVTANDDNDIIKCRARRIMLQYTKVVYISPRGRAHIITRSDKTYNLAFLREKLGLVRDRQEGHYDTRARIERDTCSHMIDDAQPDNVVYGRARKKHRVKVSVPQQSRAFRAGHGRVRDIVR